MRISGLLDEYLREHPVPPPDPNAAGPVDGEEAGGTDAAAEETDGGPEGEGA